MHAPLYPPWPVTSDTGNILILSTLLMLFCLNSSLIITVPSVKSNIRRNIFIFYIVASTLILIMSMLIPAMVLFDPHKKTNVNNTILKIPDS